jgi:hypothetical protein
MKITLLLFTAACFTTTCLIAFSANAQTLTDEQKIEFALSAAPASVAEGAAVMDWDSREVLREGNNDYCCFPSMGPMPYPMCVTEDWINFIEAMFKGEEPPTPKKMAIGYWLQGIAPMSNEHPFATPEETRKHVIAPGDPHLAILFPNPAILEGYPDDPAQGGPWVMFKDTPFVHLMVPAPAPSALPTARVPD